MEAIITSFTIIIAIFSIFIFVLVWLFANVEWLTTSKDAESNCEQLNELIRVKERELKVLKDELQHQQRFCDKIKNNNKNVESS